MFSNILNRCESCMDSFRRKCRNHHRFSRNTSNIEREMSSMTWTYDDHICETQNIHGPFFTPSSNSNSNSNKGSYDFSILNDYEFQIR